MPSFLQWDLLVIAGEASTLRINMMSCNGEDPYAEEVYSTASDLSLQIEIIKTEVDKDNKKLNSSFTSSTSSLLLLLLLSLFLSSLTVAQLVWIHSFGSQSKCQGVLSRENTPQGETQGEEKREKLNLTPFLTIAVHPSHPFIVNRKCIWDFS